MNTMTARLRAAADYMTEHGWTQGTEQSRSGQVCLTGAVRNCAPVDGDFYLIREVLRKRNRAEHWNDDSDREEGEVLTLLRTTEVTDGDLADTFGPQWVHVVALVRRAAALTVDEATGLSAAGAAAGPAAMAAAWDAAWAAAWDSVGAAAGDAAMEASWAAARGAAWDSVGDAALALVARDLITTTQYDALTRPWRTVVGPIHPDDPELKAQP